MFFWIIVCEAFVEITVLQWIGEKLSIPKHLRYYSNFLYLEQYWYSTLWALCPQQWALISGTKKPMSKMNWCSKFQASPLEIHKTKTCILSPHRSLPCFLGNPTHPLTSVVTIMMTLWSALRPAAEKCHPWDAAKKPHQTQPPPREGEQFMLCLVTGRWGVSSGLQLS